jgi:hypothetical protein
VRQAVAAPGLDILHFVHVLSCDGGARRVRVAGIDAAVSADQVLPV